jgi:DNA-binding GntR family transcriptional regulator
MVLDRMVANLGSTHLPLRDAVALELRRRIVEGELLAGDHLVESRIVASLGVSRNAVRDALRILAAERFIDVLPRKGAFVAHHSVEEVGDIFDVRLALEPLGAKLAARRCGPAGVAVLRAIVERARAATKAQALDDVADLNTEFHSRVVELGGNDYLISAALPMIQRAQWLVRRSVQARASHSWVEHERLLDAIEANDERLAEARARRHVSAARSHLSHG